MTPRLFRGSDKRHQRTNDAFLRASLRARRMRLRAASRFLRRAWLRSRVRLRRGIFGSDQPPRESASLRAVPRQSRTSRLDGVSPDTENSPMREPDAKARRTIQLSARIRLDASNSESSGRSCTRVSRPLERVRQQPAIERSMPRIEVVLITAAYQAITQSRCRRPPPGRCFRPWKQTCLPLSCARLKGRRGRCRRDPPLLPRRHPSACGVLLRAAPTAERITLRRPPAGPGQDGELRGRTSSFRPR